jgi:dihydrolipoamide dehydrogenase
MGEVFDIAVIGGGPAGYVAALKAGQSGAKTLLIEKHHLGGTCLNSGCIPSKALLASAEMIHQIHRAGEFGIDMTGSAKIDWVKVQARKDKVIATLRGGIKSLLGGRKVTVVQGSAVLDAPGSVAVTPDAGTAAEVYSARKIILATGSMPSRIPGWPTDADVICTSDEALHWTTLPRRLLIVGGGVIGCEFACMMQAMGVDVTIVEMLEQLLPNMDSRIATMLAGVFARRGIKVHTGVKIDKLTLENGLATATLGTGAPVDADRVLLATGRRPNTQNLGLERLGIAMDRGFVTVDDRMRTSREDYYCVGDANGRCMLAHAASAQAIVAVDNALGHESTMHGPIPNCVYTFPEIASVGLTADEATARGLNVAVGTFPLNFLGKALAVADNEGFVKVVRDRDSGALLGVHMLGHNATECIAAAGALLHHKVSVAGVAETIFAHPTIAESIKEAAEDSMQMALHLAPKKALRAIGAT